MKKYKVYLIIGLILFVVSGFGLTRIERAEVTAKCVEVTHTTDKYGHPYRYHYFLMPNQRIERREGGYYTVGNYYNLTTVVTSLNVIEASVVGLLIGLFFTIYGTVKIFEYL